MITIDDNNEIAIFLSEYNKDDVGVVRLDLSTYELANGLGSELIIISSCCYKRISQKALQKLKDSFAVLIFNNDDSDFDLLIPNILSIFTPRDRGDIIMNKIRFLEESSKDQNILKSQLFSLNRELADLMGGVESELLRVKKVYEVKTPKRLEEFKSFKIFSKYAAGENMGGEFFDMFLKDNKVFVLMSSTSSYLLSSSILKLFSDLKAKESVEPNDEKIIIQQLKEELSALNKSKKKEIQLDLLTCIFDTKTLEINGHCFGEFNLLSSNLKNNRTFKNKISDNLETSTFSLNLSRGERILFNSPGFSQSWKMMEPKFMIEELVINQNIKGLDVLDEIFFQIKKESINGFLPVDASSILVEVQKNAMVQI